MFPYKHPVSAFLVVFFAPLVLLKKAVCVCVCTYLIYIYISGQISIIPKPELRGFWGGSLIKPPFRVTSADVVIICV